MPLSSTPLQELFQLLQRVREIHDALETAAGTCYTTLGDLTDDCNSHGYDEIQPQIEQAYSTINNGLLNAARVCKTLSTAIMTASPVTDNLATVDGSPSYMDAINALVLENDLTILETAYTVSAGSYSVNASSSADILDIAYSTYYIQNQQNFPYESPSTLAVPGDIYCECIASSIDGKASAGNERFRFYMKEKGNFFSEVEGNNQILDTSPLDNFNILTNGSFDDWTANVPDSWTVNSGTGGTSFSEELTTVLHGSSFNLEPNQAFNISQTIGIENFRINTVYGLHWWWNHTSGDADVAYTVTIKQGSTTITSFSSGTTGGTTGWEPETLSFVLKRLDEDIEIVIASAAGDSNATYIDRMVLASLVQYNGLSWGVFLGDEDDIIETHDARSFDLSATEGNVAQFFRVHQGHSLPNVPSANVIDDSYSL